MISGRKRLRQWLDRSKLRQSEAAKTLGVHQVVLSLWLSGKRRPGRENALLLERETGIPVESWSLRHVSETDDQELNENRNVFVSKR